MTTAWPLPRSRNQTSSPSGPGPDLSGTSSGSSRTAPSQRAGQPAGAISQAAPAAAGKKAHAGPPGAARKLHGAARTVSSPAVRAPTPASASADRGVAGRPDDRVASP